MVAPAISIPGTLASFAETWSPRLVAAVNDAHVKVARLDGAFVWHAHDDSDELFYVLEGELDLEILPNPDRQQQEQDILEENAEEVQVVRMRAGDVYVVPRGVRHRPVARAAQVLLVERDTTVNTGDAVGTGRTKVPVDVRVRDSGVGQEN